MKRLKSTQTSEKKVIDYDIKKNKEAYYMVFKFEANPTLIAELERVYRITDEVLKFITTRNID